MLKKIVIIIILSVVLIKCSQNFTYAIDDTFIIANQSFSEISLSLTMAIDEYINSGSINITVNIYQKPIQSEYYYFNILYFDLEKKFGRDCYYNYTYGIDIPQKQDECSLIDVSQPCMNFSGCQNETVVFEYRLESLQYLQNLVFIENNNDMNISVKIQQQIFVYASNAWFYWTVGLACLLLINLVFLTGVVLYWSLKYKKTKRQFEQFKLTQGNNQQLKSDNHYE